MILEMFFKRRLNGLVKELHDENVLNLNNLAFVQDYVKSNRRFANFLIFICGTPLFLFLILITYNSFMGFQVENFWFNFVGSFLIIISFFYLYKDNTDREWKYVFLMSKGSETLGNVQDFGVYGGEKLRKCKYTFFDDIGYGYDGQMTVPYNFDHDFDFSPGEQVTVMFDPENPKLSMIVTPKFSNFNLRKSV